MTKRQNGPWYGCDNGDCSSEMSYPASELAVHDGKVWCEGCWENEPAIWTDGNGGDDGGDWLRFDDLPVFVSDQDRRISELKYMVMTAFIEGWSDGHNIGIGCGHSLAPRCHHKASVEWLDSDAFMVLEDK